MAHEDPEAPGTTEAAALLTQRTGLRTAGDRSTRTAQQIGQAMRRAGTSGPAYRQLLEQDPASFQDLIRHVTVGETHFFREGGHFELLVGSILPELLRHRTPEDRLRLWSAGCATGEEAYTLAILLEEQGLSDRADVLATDISADALARARAARYRAWSLRGVDADRRQAYFDQQGDRFQLHRRFVEQVTFRLLNLVADPYPAPPSGFDVIFCRNVLIYLTPEAITEVVGRLTAALSPGGWLITASTDPHLSSTPGLELAATHEAIGYRRATAPVDPGEGRPAPTDVPDAPARTQTSPGTRGSAPGRGPSTRTRVPTPSAARTRPETPRPRSGRTLHPDAEIEYQRAITSLEEARWEDAARAARRALYLEQDLVVAQIALGRAALHLGDLAGAARAWRNARSLLERTDAAGPVPLAGGASAGRLLAELAVLVPRSRVAP